MCVVKAFSWIKLLEKRDKSQLRTPMSFHENPLDLDSNQSSSDPSLRLGRNYFYPRLCFQHFTFFLFFHMFQETNFTIGNIWLFNHFLTYKWVLYTIYETYKYHFSIIFSLKIDLTVLFTHLKIILLQYFQFSTNK